MATLSSNCLIWAWYYVVDGIWHVDGANSVTSYVKLVTCTGMFCRASITSNPLLCKHIIAVFWSHIRFA